jgi:hypothetical protein
MAGTLFTAGDAGTDEAQAAFPQFPCAPGGVGIMRIAAVDDHIAWIQQRREALDELIHDRTGLDHQHHLARPLEALDQFLHAVAADDGPALRRTLDECIHPAGGAVVDRYPITVIGHVQDQILTHHCEPDQADVRLCHAVAPWNLLLNREQGVRRAAWRSGPPAGVPSREDRVCGVRRRRMS